MNKVWRRLWPKSIFIDTNTTVNKFEMSREIGGVGGGGDVSGYVHSSHEKHETLKH